MIFDDMPYINPSSSSKVVLFSSVYNSYNQELYSELNFHFTNKN